MVETMDYKAAVIALKGVATRYPLTDTEKEALQTAIGLLVWGAVGKSQVKGLKAGRRKGEGRQ